jgi:hypothetical protein
MGNLLLVGMTEGLLILHNHYLYFHVQSVGDPHPMSFSHAFYFLTDDETSV